MPPNLKITQPCTEHHLHLLQCPYDTELCYMSSMPVIHIQFPNTLVVKQDTRVYKQDFHFVICNKNNNRNQIWKPKKIILLKQHLIQSNPIISRGGGLTLTWYTYMCLSFGVLYCEIWYSDRRVFIRDEGAQIT